MNEKMTKDLNAVNEAIEKEIVFTAEVTRLGMLGDVPYMTLSVPARNGLTSEHIGIIMKDEADSEVERKSLVPLVGANIPFVILGIDEDGERLICSRACAQNKIKTQMVPDLTSGKVFEGRITNFIHYGAYVEVNGISGLLHNKDFSTDHSEVSSVYSVGDKISVRCNEVTTAGKIMWEAPVKYHCATPRTYDFEVDTVVLGTVVKIQPFASGGVGAFVRIADGLDALCLLPSQQEVEPRSRVSIKISSIEPASDEHAQLRVRGKILRVI